MSTSWSGQRRSFPPKTRRRILKRDPVCACKGCPACKSIRAHARRCTRPSTDADHVLPHHLGGSDDETNGQGLCKSCHWEKTKREIAAARALPPRKRAQEQHPGMRGGG